MALFDRPATCRAGKVMKVKTEATPQGQIWHDLGKHQEAARAAEGMIITRERGNMMDHVLLYFIKWTASDSSCIVMFYQCQPFHSCTMLHSSHLISNVTKPPAMSRIFACLQSDWLWVVQAMAH